MPSSNTLHLEFYFNMQGGPTRRSHQNASCKNMKLGHACKKVQRRYKEYKSTHLRFRLEKE